jgi:cytochrome c551/c552
LCIADDELPFAIMHVYLSLAKEGDGMGRAANGQNCSRAAAISVWLGLGLLFCQPVCAASRAEVKGGIAANEDCAACHRITRQQRQPPAVADPDEARTIEAPTFNQIARQYAGRPTALARFIMAPRHPMREQEFPPHELKQIIRYIRSLEKERW